MLMQMQVSWPSESVKLKVDTRPQLQRQPQAAVPCCVFRNSFTPWLSVGSGVALMYGRLIQNMAVNHMLEALLDGWLKVEDSAFGVGGNLTASCSLRIYKPKYLDCLLSLAMHLAAGLHSPAIVLYGSADRHSRVLSNDGEVKGYL